MTKQKTVKAWAAIDKDGELMISTGSISDDVKTFCYACSNKKGSRRDVPCTITYTLPQKRRKA